MWKLAVLAGLVTNQFTKWVLQLAVLLLWDVSVSTLIIDKNICIALGNYGTEELIANKIA